MSCVTCLSPSEHSARRLRRLLLVVQRRERVVPQLLRREHERPAAGVEKTRISIALGDGLSTVQCLTMEHYLKVEPSCVTTCDVVVDGSVAAAAASCFGTG